MCVLNEVEGASFLWCRWWEPIRAEAEIAISSVLPSLLGVVVVVVEAATGIVSVVALLLLLLRLLLLFACTTDILFLH